MIMVNYREYLALQRIRVAARACVGHATESRACMHVPRGTFVDLEETVKNADELYEAIPLRLQITRNQESIEDSKRPPEVSTF